MQKVRNRFPTARRDYKYFRALRLASLKAEFSGKINPKTKKLFTAADITDMYDPTKQSLSRKRDRIWRDTFGLFGEKGNVYISPKKVLNKYTDKKEVKALKEWLKSLKLKGKVSNISKYNLLKAVNSQEKEELLFNWSKLHGVKSASRFRSIVSEFKKKFL